MPYSTRRATRLLGALISFLVALTLGATEASAGAQSGAAAFSACGGCCAVSETCASLCAPGALAAQTGEQLTGKPLGAWCVGAVQAAHPTPVSAKLLAAAPAIRSAGPPPYLSLGRLLL